MSSVLPGLFPLTIGICGGSGSGKTTFVRRLCEHFSPDEVCLLSQDNYYLPRDQQHVDERGEYNFDLPRSFDKKAFRRDLERLRRGEVVEREEYTYNNPVVQPRWIVIQPAPVIVVEGLFIFHYKKIAAQLDLKVFINTKENLKIIRRIYRDQRERNYPLEDVLYKYQYHVMPAYERYILPYREEADLVINNNRHFEQALAVLVGFIRYRLAQYPQLAQ
ncbi:MAG: uridine kinase [Saprospiraceae bacterium]|nr:uridine kinase [Saprospiraceae bacterium]MDW8484972.1 uridine kinase [Saprospiraceae bacterium]